MSSFVRPHSSSTRCNRSSTSADSCLPKTERASTNNSQVQEVTISGTERKAPLDCAPPGNSFGLLDERVASQQARAKIAQICSLPGKGFAFSALISFLPTLSPVWLLFEFTRFIVSPSQSGPMFATAILPVLDPRQMIFHLKTGWPKW